MNKESLTNSQTQTRKSKKGLGLFALMGVAVVAVATFMGSYDSPASALSDEHALAHLESLIEQHTYFTEQHETIGDLIEEGTENQVAIMGAMAAISQAATFAKTAAPIVQGVAKIAKNLIWGSDIAVKTVDVEKIDSAFNDSRVFVAEIKKKFPNSHAVIAGLRQKLKLYQNDLSSIVQDLSLMADSTVNDCNKTARTLGLRHKILGKHTLTPEKDSKVWNRMITAMINNLQDSIDKCDEIITALSALQKHVKICSDELASEIDALRGKLAASSKKLKFKLENIEKKLKSIGCINNGKELLRAIFTLGLSCLLGQSDTKKEMLNVQADIKEEKAIIDAISKRMNYFDDLMGSAKSLVKESAGVLKTTKTFKLALLGAKNVLERDYTPEDIAENLGDVDFANDFADELAKTLASLKKSAQHVSQDCLQRKHRLDNVLSGIDKYMGEGNEEEELVELVNADQDLGLSFNKISDSCSAYFEGVSADIDRIQTGYIQNMINHLKAAKNTFLLKDKDGFSNVKIQLFNVLDAARDVLYKIESAQYRLGGNTHKINRYIGKRADWYYQHKYSVNTAINCASDKKLVEEDLAKLTLAYQKFYSKMVPTLTQNVSSTLKKETNDATHVVQKLIRAKQAEPQAPVYEVWKVPAALNKIIHGGSADDDQIDDAKKQLRSLYNIFARKDAAAKNAFHNEHSQWKRAEISRQAQLKIAKSEMHEAKQSFEDFDKVMTKMTKETKNRDDDIHSFSDKLEAQMKKYQTDITANLKKGADMTDANNKAAIARNNKSTAIANKSEEATKTRGKHNQAVKRTIIFD